MMLETIESSLINQLPNNTYMLLQINHSLFRDKGGTRDLYVRKTNVKGHSFIEYGYLVASSSFSKTSKREFKADEDVRNLIDRSVSLPTLLGFDFGYEPKDVSLDFRIDKALNIVDLYQKHFEVLYNRIYREGIRDEFIIKDEVTVNKRLIDLLYKAFDDYTIKSYLDLMARRVHRFISYRKNKGYDMMLYKIFGTYVPVLASSTCLENPMLAGKRSRDFTMRSQLYADAKRHEVEYNGFYVYFITNEKLCYDINSKKPFVLLSQIADQLLLSTVSDSEILPSINNKIYVTDEDAVSAEVYDKLPADEKTKYLEMDKLHYLCLHSNSIKMGISPEDMYESLKNMSLIAKKEV